MKDKRLPYVFDLLFDCKTERDVRKAIEYLENKVKELKSLKEYWDKYERGVL